MEEISNLNIAITATTAGGEENIGQIAYLAHIFELFQGIEQLIGTVPEYLQIVPFVPAFIYIKNLGTTIVIVDSVNTMDAFPQRIIPGGCLCLAPQIDTIWVKTSGPGKIWVISVH